MKICTRCLKERKRESRRVRKPVVFGVEHERQEKKRLMIMAIIAAVLLLIILFSTLGLL